MARRIPRNPDAVAFFEARAQAASSPDELRQLLAFLPRLPNHVAFRTVLAYYPGDLSQASKRWLRRDTTLRVYNQNALAYEIFPPPERRAPAQDRRPPPAGVFALFPGSQGGILRLTTVSRADFWNRGVRRFLRRAYPFVSRILLDQREFRDALLRLEKHVTPKNRLVITELVLKEPRPGESPGSRITRFDSDRKWTEAPLRDILIQVQERGQWFASVGFSIQRHDTKRGVFIAAAKGRLYKNGELHLSDVLPDLAEVVLAWLEEAAVRRIELLSNRGLRERNYDPARPIELDFSDAVFSEPSQLSRFASVIARYPNSTKAVFHSNPYYHATVADVRDGSSVDIWVLSSSRVLLVPQAKSTAPAFGRLITHIFSHFGEGKVGEYNGSLSSR